RVAPYPELGNRLLHLRIIWIRRSQLKRVRLLEQQEVLDAHRRFARVIQSRLQLGSRIVSIRPRHPRRQRWRRLRSKRIPSFFLGFLRGRRCCRLLGLRLWRSCGRLRLHPAHIEAKNKRGPEYTQGETGHSVHRFSSDDFFSNIFCIILISARCPLSTSVAKL